MGVSRLWNEAPFWRSALMMASAMTVIVFFFPPGCTGKTTSQPANGTPGSSPAASTGNGQGSFTSSSPPVPPVPSGNQSVQSGPKVITAPRGAVTPVTPPLKIKPGFNPDSVTVENHDDDFGTIKDTRRK